MTKTLTTAWERFQRSSDVTSDHRSKIPSSFTNHISGTKREVISTQKSTNRCTFTDMTSSSTSQSVRIESTSVSIRTSSSSDNADSIQHITSSNSLKTGHPSSSLLDTIESTIETRSPSPGLPEWGLYTIMALGSLVVMLLFILCGCAYVLRRKNLVGKGKKRISSFFKGYEAARTHEERLYTLPNATRDPKRMFHSREDLSVKKEIYTSESVSKNEFIFEDFKTAKPLNEVDPEKASKIKHKNRSRLPAPPPKPVKVEDDLDDYMEMKTSLKRVKSPIREESDESPERHLTESGYIMTPPNLMQQTSVTASGSCQTCSSMQGADRMNALPHNCDYQTAQSIETLKNVFSALPGNIVVVNLDNPQNTLKANKSFRNLPSAQACFHDEPKTQVFSPTFAASPKFPRQNSSKALQPAVHNQYGPVSYTTSNPGYGLIAHRSDDVLNNINDQVIHLGHDNGSSDDFSDPPSDVGNQDYNQRMKHNVDGSGDYCKASALRRSSDSKTRQRSDDNLSEEIYDELCPLEEDNIETVSRLGQKEPSLKRPPYHQRASVDLK